MFMLSAVILSSFSSFHCQLGTLLLCDVFPHLYVSLNCVCGSDCICFVTVASCSVLHVCCIPTGQTSPTAWRLEQSYQQQIQVDSRLCTMPVHAIILITISRFTCVICPLDFQGNRRAVFFQAWLSLLLAISSIWSEKNGIKTAC